VKRPVTGPTPGPGLLVQISEGVGNSCPGRRDDGIQGERLV
jgi:hypothetical protein